MDAARRDFASSAPATDSAPLTKAIANLTRLLRTLRHLKPVQVWGRAWLRLYRPRVDERPAPAVRLARAPWRGCARASSMTGPMTFRFLNVERTLRDGADWNRADWPRLWVYNLHYFDDLVADAYVAAATAPTDGLSAIAAAAAPTDGLFASAAATAPTKPIAASAAPVTGQCRSGGSRDPSVRSGWHRDLITRWIAENPPPRGVGWEPYPTSLRIVNWIKWTLAGNTPDATTLHSLAVQARWLRKRLEFHLLGNHLWANAKALVFAGAFFTGGEGARWLQRGTALVRRELAEQILTDGGHFERSPMYHAIVLEDLLDLIHLAGRYPDQFDTVDVASWRDTATRMLQWLRVMTHPDGGIALFNDAALGIAPDYAALAAYALRLGVSVNDAPLKSLEALSDSGYVRMQVNETVLIADVGAIGPDYLPGHAHADTLSFELSLADKRVLVNGGTSTYENNAERLRQRGTAAHNTVVVDGVDSSEVWSAFRVGRRAHPRDVGWGEDADGLWLRASHDGYQHLPGSPIHRREWRLSVQALAVTDKVDGNCEHAEARFRFAPPWRAAAATDLMQPASAGAAAAATDPLQPASVGAAAAAIDPSQPASAGAPAAAACHHELTIHGNAPCGRDFRHSYIGPGAAPELRVQSSPGAHVVDASYHPAFGVDSACELIVLPFGADGAVFRLTWHRSQQ